MSLSRVEYPPVTPLALSWLREHLTGVAVAGRIPNPIPAGGLVVPRRSGGTPDAAFRSRPRIDAQCWDDDWPAAERLAERVMSILHAATGEEIEGVLIGQTQVFVGPTAVSDPLSDAPRYILTVEWQVSGTQL
jgi:hypothetical protein